MEKYSYYIVGALRRRYFPHRGNNRAANSRPYNAPNYRRKNFVLEIL